MTKIGWGVLGDAKIAREQLNPAIDAAHNAELVAVASRRSGLSYEALLARDDIQAVYIPLPNHLHVPWAIKALEAGKHVLCEKPIALSAQELLPLLDTRPDLLLAEAFMVLWHPQWSMVEHLIAEGAIGELRHIDSHFSYYNADPGNVRNQPNMGGGGLLDIGCYPLYSARRLFGDEPLQAASMITQDPATQVDTTCSAMAAFPGARHLTFYVSTLMSPAQELVVHGTEGRIIVTRPYNPVANEPSEIKLERRDQPLVFHSQHSESCNQYQLQVEAFSASILDGSLAWPRSRDHILAQSRALDLIRSSCLRVDDRQA